MPDLSFPEQIEALAQKVALLIQKEAPTDAVIIVTLMFVLDSYLGQLEHQTGLPAEIHVLRTDLKACAEHITAAMAPENTHA